MEVVKGIVISEWSTLSNVSWEPVVTGFYLQWPKKEYFGKLSVYRFFISCTSSGEQ